jgi:chromosome partitioning protein
MPFVISIANEKGGVAKTTTAISLAGAWVELGLRVLMIDLDAQANLSLALGVEPAKVHPSVVSVLVENAPMHLAIRKTEHPGLDILPSNGETGLAERILPTRSGYEYVLRKAIQNEDLKYDYIVMDCPPFLGAVTLSSLTASNLLIMPTQAEYFSIYALRNMMSLIRRVRAQTNPQLTYRLLITMFDRRNRIHRTMNDQLQSAFGSGMLQNIIEVDTKLRESPIAGTPIIFHAPKSRAATQYRALAQEIYQYVQETAQQPA